MVFGATFRRACAHLFHSVAFICIFYVHDQLAFFRKDCLLPTYETLANEYRETMTRTGRLFEYIDDDTANKQPSPNRWSMLDCIGHLIAIGDAYMQRIEHTLAKTADRVDSRGDGKTDRVRYSMIGRYMIRQMEPPPGLKFKSPRTYQPQSVGGIEETRMHFLTLQSEMLRLLDRLAAQRTPRTLMSSPVIPVIILPLPDWFGLVAAHARRHLWQAEQAKLAVTEG